MKSIIVNYKVRDSISNEYLQQIVESCKSTTYDVILNIYDFSLEKNISQQIQSVDIKQKNDSYTKIQVIKSDYEDYSSGNDHIYKNIIAYADSVAFTIIEPAVLLNSNAIDQVEFEVFDDDNIGCLYFDYDYITGDTKTRVYLFSGKSEKSIPLPILFFSTKKLLESISHEKPDSFVFSTSVAKHIPKSLCTVNL